MENEETAPSPIEDHSAPNKPDASLLAVCDRHLTCDLTLYRPILDRCVEVASNISNHSSTSGAQQDAVNLAHAVVKLIRTYFPSVQTGLELATYVRYVLLLSGFSDVEPPIKDAVYGQSSSFLSGDEFLGMNQQLGTLVLSGESSRSFSISCRPATFFYQENLDLNGLFTKRILEEEARSLAFEQLKARQLVTDADLIAYREENASRQQAIKAKEAELRLRKAAAHKEFLRRNRY